MPSLSKSHKIPDSRKALLHFLKKKLCVSSENANKCQGYSGSWKCKHKNIPKMLNCIIKIFLGKGRFLIGSADSLEKAGTSSFSDSGTNLLPEKFNLDLWILTMDCQFPPPGCGRSTSCWCCCCWSCWSWQRVEPRQPFVIVAVENWQLLVNWLRHSFETFPVKIPWPKNSRWLGSSFHLQIPWKKHNITFCLSLCLASLERDGRAVVVVVVVVVTAASVVGFV